MPTDERETGQETDLTVTPATLSLDVSATRETSLEMAATPPLGRAGQQAEAAARAFGSLPSSPTKQQQQQQQKLLPTAGEKAQQQQGQLGGSAAAAPGGVPQPPGSTPPVAAAGAAAGSPSLAKLPAGRWMHRSSSEAVRGLLDLLQHQAQPGEEAPDPALLKVRSSSIMDNRKAGVKGCVLPGNKARDFTQLCG